MNRINLKVYRKKKKKNVKYTEIAIRDRFPFIMPVLAIQQEG